MNVPKLRFKDNNGNDYPQWEKKKLGDIGDIVGGGTPSSSNEEYWNGNINWFTPSEIGKTKFVSESIRKITTKGLNNSSAKLLPKGTILLSSRATIGEKSILLNPATTNQGFQSIITNDKVVNEFIYYYIDTLKKELIKQASGSTFLEISNTIVKKLKIYIPLLEEQNKIAKFLSTVDKKIANLEDIITNLEKQKKGLLQQIFNQELRFKDKNGNNYPDWKHKQLGDIATLKNGISKGNEAFGHGKKFINLQDIFNKSYIFNDNYSLVDVTEKELSENNLLKGDVLFVRSSVKREGVGLPCVIMENLIDTVYSGFIIRCRFNTNENIYLHYKKYCFLESSFRKALLKKSSSSANTNINQDNLSKLYVKLPCLEEQTKIADFLSAFDRKIDNQKAQLEHWKQIKKGLLQQMFV